MQDMVNTLKSLRQSCKALNEEERRSVSLSETPVCNSVLDQMSWMQKPEEEKLRLCQEFPLPKNVSIDENQEVNRLFFSLLVLLVVLDAHLEQMEMGRFLQLAPEVPDEIFQDA